MEILTGRREFLTGEKKVKILICRRPLFFPHTEFEAIRHTLYYHFDLELIRTFFVSREGAAIGLKGHGNERKRPDSSTLVVNLDSIALAKKSQSRRFLCFSFPFIRVPRFPVNVRAKKGFLKMNHSWRKVFCSKRG